MLLAESGGGRFSSDPRWRQKLRAAAEQQQPSWWRGGGFARLTERHATVSAGNRRTPAGRVLSVYVCFAEGADLPNRHVHRPRACARRDRDRTRRHRCRAAVSRRSPLR